MLVAGVEGLVWKTLCDRIISAFPNIQNLSIEVLPNSSAPQLLMPDISSLISASNIKSFCLNSVPYCLTEANIVSLANAWPGLRTLRIRGDYGVFFRANVLIELSKSSHLHELALPLDLSDLGQPLPQGTTTSSDCPLNELIVTRFSSAPSGWDCKARLAENILLLFPVLDRVSTGEVEQQIYLNEVQAFVQAFHGLMIANYARQRHWRALSGDRRELAVRPPVDCEVGSKEEYIVVATDK